MGQFSQKNRAIIFRRANGHCEECGVKLPVKGWHADHIHAEALGGTDDPDNGQALCEDCHSLKTNGPPHTSYGSDKHAMAKTKRLAKGPRQRKGRPLHGRGFDKTKSRRFDGTVVERKR